MVQTNRGPCIRNESIVIDINMKEGERIKGDNKNRVNYTTVDRRGGVDNCGRTRTKWGP